MSYIQITLSNGILSIAHEIEVGRKQRLSASQKNVEDYVKKIHNAVKCSVYLETYVNYAFCDYYDEGDREYCVAGAVIRKGDRSVRNTSWSKTSIPKSWSRITMIKFKTSKVSAPINNSLKILGYNITDDDIKSIKRLLKANSEAYVIPEFSDVNRRSELCPWSESVPTGAYLVCSNID